MFVCMAETSQTVIISVPTASLTYHCSPWGRIPSARRLSLAARLPSLAPESLKPREINNFQRSQSMTDRSLHTISLSPWWHNSEACILNWILAFSRGTEIQLLTMAAGWLMYPVLVPFTSLSRFPISLVMFPGLTLQMDYLDLNPHLRTCFWELYLITSSLIIFIALWYTIIWLP